MRIAFVVLTYNRADALLAALRALAPQCGPRHEVIVADDGSRAEQVAAMREGLPKFDCRVRHVWHPDVGFTASRARNLGARAAEADYLVFMDGDCVPTPHYVRMHETLAQPGCFVNGSRVLLSDAFSRDVIERRADPAALGLRDWVRKRTSGDVNKLAHLVSWPDAPCRIEKRFRWKGIRSCNFGVWKNGFEEVNGFDETFAGWGHEDADLVLRLHHAGAMRKNGYLATEVLHLWHRENSRASESTNRDRVVARMETGIIRAEAGLAQSWHSDKPVVTELNR